MLNGKLLEVLLRICFPTKPNQREKITFQASSKAMIQGANVEWESIGDFCTIASFSHGHPCILHRAGKTLNDCRLSQLEMDICQNSCETIHGPAGEFSDRRFLLFRFMSQLLGSPFFLTFMISSEGNQPAWGYVGNPPPHHHHKIKVSECVVRVSEAVEIEIRRPNSPAKANIYKWFSKWKNSICI